MHNIAIVVYMLHDCPNYVFIPIILCCLSSPPQSDLLLVGTPIPNCATYSLYLTTKVANTRPVPSSLY